jgi:mRNA interferase RelE/StbE
MYSLVLSRRFDSDFSKLDKGVRDRVVEKLREISGDPRVGKPLRGKLRGLYSARAGDYRIVYQIFDEKRVVAAVMVGHRKVAYR